MTTNQKFLMAIRLYCEGLDTVAVGCLGPKCQHADGDPDHSCETYFSSGQCDSCGSTLGGDHSEAHGIWRDDTSDSVQSIEMSICIDCMMYHANDQLPEDTQ